MGNPVTSHTDEWIKKMHLLLPSLLTPTSFDSDVEECRKKNGGGLETQEGGEEEDTEGVDHYEDASHWLMVPHAASDTNTPEMRALPWHHGINQCGKTTLMRATVHEQQRVSPNMTS